MKKKIAAYNFLTVVFAVATVVCIGSVSVRSDLFTIVRCIALCAYLTYDFFIKENRRRARLKRKLRRRKMRASLRVMQGGAARKSRVA